nr:hypothetical protein [Cohnella faecalis]
MENLYSSNLADDRAGHNGERLDRSCQRAAYLRSPIRAYGGGPAGASETLSVKIYRYAFSSTELSQGLSASFILTLIALVVTFFFIALSRKFERGTMGE